MNLRAPIILVLVVGKCLMASVCAAQIGIVSAVVMGKTAKDIIGELERAAGNTVLRAKNAGDVALLNASSQASVAAGNIAAILGDQIDKQVSALEPQYRQMMQRAYDLSQAVDNVAGTAKAIEQSLNLDLRGILGHLGGEKLYIDRIHGVTQIENSNQYLIGVDGVGVGAASQNRRPRLGLRLDGKDVSVIVNPSAATSATLTLQPAAIAPFVKKGSVAMIPATLVAELDYKSGWLFKRWRTTRVESPFFIAVLSKDAGKITALATTPKHDWVRVDRVENAVNTGNHHCSNNCRNQPTRTGYTATLSVKGGNGLVGDRRLVNLSLDCTSGPCAFSSKGALAMGVGNASAQWPFDVWSGPMTWNIKADVQELQIVGDAILELEVPLQWGEDFLLNVPKATTFLRVRGTLNGNIPVDFAINNPASSTILKLVQEGTTGNNKTYQIRLHPPVN